MSVGFPLDVAALSLLICNRPSERIQCSIVLQHNIFQLGGTLDKAFATLLKILSSIPSLRSLKYPVHEYTKYLVEDAPSYLEDATSYLVINLTGSCLYML